MRRSRIFAHAAFIVGSVGTIAGATVVADSGWAEARRVISIPFMRAYRIVVPTELVRHTRALEWTSTRWEVLRAVHRHDFRLVGIGGLGLFFPGLEGKEPEVARVTARYGYRYIEGTSDYADSDDQASYQHAAYEYAKAYNRLLLPEIPK